MQTEEYFTNFFKTLILSPAPNSFMDQGNINPLASLMQWLNGWVSKLTKTNLLSSFSSKTSWIVSLKPFLPRISVIHFLGAWSAGLLSRLPTIFLDYSISKFSCFFGLSFAWKSFLSVNCFYLGKTIKNTKNNIVSTINTYDITRHTLE